MVFFDCHNNAIVLPARIAILFKLGHYRKM